MRLLLIIGPPAVGKMTVGRAVADRSTFTLFHNHHTIELLLELFDHGSAPFRTLNAEFRRRIVEEAAASGTDLIFSFVWELDLEEDAAFVERLVAPYAERGADISVVELVADLDTRLDRNRTEHRLEHKRSKRDVEWSEGNVRRIEGEWRMRSEPGRDAPGERLLARWPHLVVDNTDLEPGTVAERILTWLVTRQ